MPVERSYPRSIQAFDFLGHPGKITFIAIDFMTQKIAHFSAGSANSEYPRR